MVIPLRIALFDRDENKNRGEQVVILSQPQVELSFPGFARKPVLSMNRGFSAPVNVDIDSSADDLLFLAAHDDDPFARYEALQQLVVQHLVAAIGGGMLCEAERAAGREAIGQAFAAVVADPALDDLMRGELMALPGETYLAEQFERADPGAIRAEREGLKAWLGMHLQEALVALHTHASAVPYDLSAEARGARKVKTQALVLLAAGVPELAAELASTRRRDRAAQRTLTGPHRDELLVTMAGKGQPASACSTGEQKALLIAITLAHADLLQDSRPALLLLDEVAAHLDPLRRAALFDRLRAGAETFHALKSILKEAGHVTAVGDEGGFAPKLTNSDDAFGTLVKAIEKAGTLDGAKVRDALAAGKPVAFR